MALEDYDTVVIPLTIKDRAFLGDLERFRQQVQSRLQDMFIILVDEAGIPLAPPIDVAAIPKDAIWLPKFEL